MLCLAQINTHQQLSRHAKHCQFTSHDGLLKCSKTVGALRKEDTPV